MQFLKQCLIFVIAIIMIVAAALVFSKVQKVLAPSIAEAKESGRLAWYFNTDGGLDKKAIDTYVATQAREYGVAPALAVCIVRKESINYDLSVMFGPRTGDNHLTCNIPDSPFFGKPVRSRGPWQWNECAHWNVSDLDAFSIEESTKLAMPQLKLNPWIWSTYKDCL